MVDSGLFLLIKTIVGFPCMYETYDLDVSFCRSIFCTLVVSFVINVWISLILEFIINLIRCPGSLQWAHLIFRLLVHTLLREVYFKE